MGTVSQCLCQGLVRMGAYHFFFALCFTTQALGSPLHAVFLPYLYQPCMYTGCGPMPAVEPVVVEIETEFTCTTNGSFPDPESCHKYYVCNIMPDGFLKGFVCDWPTSEDCKHQVSVVACSSLEGDEARTLCQERLNLEVSPVVIELETDLECSDNGTFADPYNCDKYYSCVEIDGQLESFQFDCPPGLLFNAEVGECDYAESVDCAVQEQIEVDVCTGPELSEEQRTLCHSNAWKHTDHF